MLLVRVGVIPEVTRCTAEEELTLDRGQSVVVETHRGLMVGTVLEVERRSGSESAAGDDSSPSTQVQRPSTEEDLVTLARLSERAHDAFGAWQARITEWGLDLQLIDLEWTLDESKLILYVLSDRGPDCTKLALHAAAAGLGAIEVQPVSAEGLVTLATAQRGCGTCGCG